ncbi:hypothetical protein [Fimbriiglobus ruber]|uniref:Uncharacterized protein n=1 Tax=Fimbriiglobus ruber TaxID=1908690 RepID=A0A225DE59_9BACT|nr:hypothetical protein [Fimbriiglobus ruber]OWK39752.1 hypothetical protein FRUB_05642 [Fimbriiglobus ruber]
MSGKVTYKGVSLKGGNVVFVSTDGGRSVSSSIAEDGSYSGKDIDTGTYKVCVETKSLKPPDGWGRGAMMGGSSGRPGGADKPLDAGTAVPPGYTPSSPGAAVAARNAKRYVMIPDEYGDSTKTTLSIAIQQGAQTYDIDIK